MGFLYESLFTIAVAIIYAILCYKIADVMFKDQQYKDKFQNMLTLLYVLSKNDDICMYEAAQSYEITIKCFIYDKTHIISFFNIINICIVKE